MIHLLGARLFVDHYPLQNTYSDCRVYSSVDDPGSQAFPYESIYSYISAGDTIVSYLPIAILIPLLSRIKVSYTLVALSSSSIYSKVFSNTPDSSAYQHFLIGESRLISIYANSLHLESLVILRCHMLYCYPRDKNISRIISFALKYRLIPLSSRSDGLRAPLHFSYLNNVICNIVNSRLPTNLYIWDLPGPQLLSHRDICLTVQAILQGHNIRVFLLPIPYLLVSILLKLSVIFPSSIRSILSMFLRQSENLVFTSFPMPSQCLPQSKSFYDYLDTDLQM